ncbi:MAG TPA: glycine--tRNA ligase subunit beta [Steroidobacteraceae bacterium]|jgi:glycyl-tRNA synthetase beta chain
MNIERRDFLVEVGTEELPPKSLRALELAFASAVRSGLEAAGLTFKSLVSFATPRRLAVCVKKLAAQQPQQDIKRRGPPVSAAFDAAGQPTRAALAFAQTCGVSLESLQRLDEGKGTFLFYIGTKPGAPAVQLLPGIVQRALDGLPVARRMHWGSSSAEFVRPVHWLVMLFGKDVIPATILDTAAGALTRGHRFHAPKPLRVSSPASYESALRTRGFVLASFVARRDLIKERVSAAATQLGGRALIGDALLDEVTALVEWPMPLAGRFEERFLRLPREVLISTLQDHQRYFPVEDAAGKLMSHFITVSNIESRDPDKVREGNERVVRPRLADAAFFWEQDRKVPLSTRRERLDAVTFQAKLGSLGDKTRRVRTLAGEIAAARGAERAESERAAELCKCDLLTAMVGEFPELQGIMGTYYALADGEAPEVAVAIREHYLPRGAGDELPATHAGVAVAIADKLDTLTGIFAIGEKPTGAKDPFGLRRAAIGVLRILIETGLDLDLRRFISRAVELALVDVERVRAAAATRRAAADAEKVGAGGIAAASGSAAAGTAGSPPAGAGASAQKPAQVAKPPPSPEVIATEVYDYIMERLRAYYLERSDMSAAPAIGGAAITTEMFDAALAMRPASPLDFDARLKALSAFLELPEAASLTAANKRIANILRKSSERRDGEVAVESLKEEAEVRLFDAMRAMQEAVSTATAQREYANALGRLAQLRPAIDAFFDQVMVMDEDPRLRANRLALLAQLHSLFSGVADLSRLPG